MKNLKNTLLTMLLIAFSSPSLVAMKRQPPVDANNLPGVPAEKKGRWQRTPFTAPIQQPLSVGKAKRKNNENDGNEAPAKKLKRAIVYSSDEQMNDITSSFATLSTTDPIIIKPFGGGMVSHMTNIFQGDVNPNDLQDHLDALCSFSYLGSEAKAACLVLVSCIRMRPLQEIQALFCKLTGKSTLMMALCLVCAQEFKFNLDADLDCIEFLANIGKWVNGIAVGQQTVLFSQDNLRFVLPLLEYIICKPVTILNLGDNQLTSIPCEIGQLDNLKTLILSRNELSGIPPEIDNLGKLKVLYLFNNQFSDIEKIALRKRFTHVRNFDV